jgi:predicted dehydrogenase
VRIGQIGIGHNHGAAKMATLRKLHEHFEVVGVAEPDPEWRRKRGNDPAYQGLPWLTEEQLLNIQGLEAVAVETDVPELIPAARRCVAAGMHLHLDKPGGESMAPFKALLADADRRGVAIQMGYMFRNNPTLQFCFRAVREGWIGRVFEVHAVMSRMDGMDYRAWLSQFRGGAMYIFGGHLIDLVVTLLGEPERVTPYQRQTWPETDALFDNGLAVFEYARATATVRTAVVEYEGFKRRQLVVCGDEGTIDIRPIEPNGKNPEPTRVRLALSRPRESFTSGYQEFEMPALPGRYDDQLLELARVVRGEQQNPYSAAHEIVVQQALLTASGYPPAQAAGQ